MRIAVIGGGIFGISIATKLAENYIVDLFEQNNDILKSASDVNQCRIHRGYHYPRSDTTTKYVNDSEKSFIKEFSYAVMHNVDNFYCISKTDSLTSAKQYLAFCKRNNLEYDVCDLDIINKDSIDLCVKVKENLFDHQKLKIICWKKIHKSRVNVFLNKKVTNDIFLKYDFVINCTYANLNELLQEYPKHQLDYQFEVCEKIFMKLPESFNNKSVLVMDGPFMSVDPVGNTGDFIIGDVVNTVLHSNIGKYPKIPNNYLSLMNKGIITNPPFTNFKLFIQSASRFFPEISKAHHVGSSYCVKTVLPNVEESDERPTIIKKINEKIITVFSGKITTCIETSNDVLKMIQKK